MATTRRCRWGIALFAAVLAGVVCRNAAAGGGTGDDLAREAARLARENMLLKQEIELASGPEFYLIVDAQTRKLRVMLAGVLLREYPLQRVSTGLPRVLFVQRSAPEAWQEKIWTHGQLDPPRERDRLVIVAGADSAGLPVPDPPIPPTPEEAVPAPPTYRICYDGGLALEVVTDPPVAGSARPNPWERLKARIRTSAAAILHQEYDPVRLQLVLSPSDAAKLYRSLPPDSKLLLALHPSAS